MNPPRFISFLYVVILAGLGLAAGALYFDARAEYEHQKRLEADNRRRLAEAEARLSEQEVALTRLRSDPAYVERALRERYHARPGEVIFRFQD